MLTKSTVFEFISLSGELLDVADEKYSDAIQQAIATLLNKNSTDTDKQAAKDVLLPLFDTYHADNKLDKDTYQKAQKLISSM